MLILIGPSASGKTEIAKILISKYGFKKFVTTTTRTMRVNEVQDVDYHFISKEEFLERKANNEFIETAEYSGNFYGTYKKEIDDNKVLIVEPLGLSKFLEVKDYKIVTFYIEASEEIRKERMINRQDNLESIEKRLEIDRIHFSEDCKKLCDCIIDNNGSKKLEELASEIYVKYRNM